MNPRIQELAEQAWNDTREKFGSFVDDGGEIDYTFLHAYDQKFAELIVKECADIANRQFSAATGLDDRDCLTAKQMKQLFGVEE